MKPDDIRIAAVRSNWRDWDKAEEAVANYLPDNYEVIGKYAGMVIIAGRDSMGWTFEGYVEPRLASGLYFATELEGVPA